MFYCYNQVCDTLMQGGGWPHSVSELYSDKVSWLQWTSVVSWIQERFLPQKLAVSLIIKPCIGDCQIKKVENYTLFISKCKWLLYRNFLSVMLHPTIQLPMLLLCSSIANGLETWTYLLSFSAHLLRVSWGLIPEAEDALTIGL